MTNKFYALALTLVMGAASADAPDPRSDFLAAYYKGYVSHLGRGTVSYVKATPFYSASLKALLESNKQACAQLSRGDDICGFGADGDMVLDAQDMAEGLVFDRMSFKAKPVAENVMDVSFSVFPANPKAERSNLQYVLVQEEGNWRVDDVLYKVGGKFKPENSMRRRIGDEIANLEKNARSLKEATTWLAIYAENPMPDRFVRFIGFPVEICAKGGACKSYGKKDVPVRKLVADIHDRYFPKRAPKGGFKDPLHGAAAKEPATFADGTVVKSGPFDFTFRQKAWWLTKVDWSRPQ